MGIMAGGIWGVFHQLFFARKGKNKKLLFSPLFYLPAFFFWLILLKLFFVEINRVSGPSMQPTLLDGDYVLLIKWKYGPRLPRSWADVPWVNHLCYFFSSSDKIHRRNYKNYPRLYSYGRVAPGDILIFNLPPYESKRAIKRCVGIPGDYVGLTPENVPVRRLSGVNSDSCMLIPFQGMKTNFSQAPRFYRFAFGFYARDCSPTEGTFDHNYYYVAGDNLPYSRDSREWGLLREDHIIGQAVCILFSVDEKGKIRWNRLFQTIR